MSFTHKRLVYERVSKLDLYGRLWIVLAQRERAVDELHHIKCDAGQPKRKFRVLLVHGCGRRRDDSVVHRDIETTLLSSIAILCGFNRFLPLLAARGVQARGAALCRELKVVHHQLSVMAGEELGDVVPIGLRPLVEFVETSNECRDFGHLLGCEDGNGVRAS